MRPVRRSPRRVASDRRLRQAAAVVRHLPVLQTPPSEDAEAEARPAWKWVVIGAAFVVVVFLPLSVVGLWAGGQLARRVEGAAVRLVLSSLPVLGAYAIAAGSAGAFVGRFGRRAGTLAVGLSGASGGAILFALGALGGTLSPWTVAFGAAVALIGGGCLFALLGARLGRRWARPR